MNIPLFFLKYLELKVNAYRSRDSLLRMRMRKFRGLARFVYENSPYYRSLIQERNIDPERCTPEDFPVLTKRAVMEHFDEIVTAPEITKAGIAEYLTRSQDPIELYRGKYVVLHTSGSSGEIGYFVYSMNDWWRGYAQFSRLHPLTWKRRKAAYFGATLGHFAGVSQFVTSTRFFINLLYHSAVYEINSPLQPVLDGLNALQPQVLAGYPSALLMLARKQLAGELHIAPSFVETGGEPLLPEVRIAIERAFTVPALDLYASTEHMLMAKTDPSTGSLLLFEDDLIFELHTDHICVTNLFNRTLPLIRYRMDDVLQEDGDSGTRTPYKRVKNLVGRSEQALILNNRDGREDFISPFIIIEFQVRNLRRFQIVMKSRTSFLFKACLDHPLTERERERTFQAIRSRLYEILSQKGLDNVTYEIEEAADIPADPKTGKFRLIVQ